MSADPFRRAVDDDVGTVLDRSQQVSAHPEGVVNDQGNFVSVRNLVFSTIRNRQLVGWYQIKQYLCELGNRCYVIFGVSDRFNINSFGIFVDCFGKLCWVRTLNELDIDAKSGEKDWEMSTQERSLPLPRIPFNWL